MISEEEHKLWARIGEVYDLMLEEFKPYSDNYEFIRKYQTSNHPLAVEYRELIKERNRLNDLNRPLYEWIPGEGHVPIYKSIEMDLPICKSCGKDTGNTFHMEGPNRECMRCYCTRVIYDR